MMKIDSDKKDLVLLIILILVLLGLPFGIRAYDRYLVPEHVSRTKEFTLTGSAKNGWILGEVRARDIVSLWQNDATAAPTVISVFRGDRVVLKLRSSDVTHGFSLKAFDIYLTDGIQPGQTKFVSFTADKVGTFVFSCNVFCGGIHRNMLGTLVVREAQPVSAGQPDVNPRRAANTG